MASERFTSKVHAWFCSTDLPSDVVIQVEDISFHLHKLPLILKSRKLYELIAALEERANAKLGENEEKKEDEEDYLKLPEFPGGSETFEIAAKFCYGVKIDLSPSNVAALQCAGDYLQMTDDHFEDNLNSVTELFFSTYVLRNIKHSIQTLHSCQRFLLLAENLGIVQRCIDSIAAKSSSIDPSLFGWPVSESAAALSRTNTPLRLDGAAIAGPKFWFKELAILDLNIFKRVIIAMKVRYTKPEIIESCLISYAKKHNLLNSRANRNKSSSSSSSSNSSEIDHRELLETIIAYLPMQKSSNSPTSTKFLCGLLRTAYILNASEICRSMLEKKIGSQLEQATLDDLLIPSYSYLTETLYDVDFVERVLEYFLEGLDGGENDEGGDDSGGGGGGRLPALMSVGKLMDDFLSEIASDGSLTPERFYQLSVSLPEHARLFDDGLYRAIDIFLKVHPWISEGDKEKICSILDCQKLTLEACTHAAQNDRLPLRTVVQVLFFEQMQLRHAITDTASPAKTPRFYRIDECGKTDNGSPYMLRDKARENRVLRRSMDGMRTRMHELEHECSTMKKVIEKIDKVSLRDDVKCWSSKLGCKFNTQVCDSQQPSTAVVEYKKGRSHHHTTIATLPRKIWHM